MKIIMIIAMATAAAAAADEGADSCTRGSGRRGRCTTTNCRLRQRPQIKSTFYQTMKTHWKHGNERGRERERKLNKLHCCA